MFDNQQSKINDLKNDHIEDANLNFYDDYRVFFAILERERPVLVMYDKKDSEGLFYSVYFLGSDSRINCTYISPALPEGLREFEDKIYKISAIATYGQIVIKDSKVCFNFIPEKDGFGINYRNVSIQSTVDSWMKIIDSLDIESTRIYISSDRHLRYFAAFTKNLQFFLTIPIDYPIQARVSQLMSRNNLVEIHGYELKA